MPLLIFFKQMMKWMIMMTIIVTISSSNWFIFWIMMEMNMMMFIPILKQNKLENCMTMISYFIIQSFSSIMFFMFFIMILYNYSIINEIMINISLMIKLGMIPFHSWLIYISESMSYNSLMIILTMQKIIPLFITFKLNSKISMVISVISVIFSTIMIYNLKLFKKILIFSSISHLSWMIIIMHSNSNFWICYMIIYFMMIMTMIKTLKNNNINSMFNLMSKKLSMNNKINIIMALMSLGGMPPFIGFVIKFMAIMTIINYSYLSMLVLIMSSLINIFIYIRMIMPILLNFNKSNINMKFNMNNKNIIMNYMIILTFITMNMII